MTGILDANIRKLEIGTLMVLHRLLLDPNLSRIGREVGLSQPAMSHLLARLRRLFGDPLLVRDGKALVPTTRAQAIRQRLETLLPELAVLFDDETFEPGKSTALIKMAITDHAGQVLLAGLLRELNSAAPLMRTSIAMIPNRQTDLAVLDAGQFDLRIGWLRSLPPDWHQRKLLDDEIVLIGAYDNVDLATPLTVERFVALPHVGLESETPIYPNLIDSRLAALGLERNVVSRVSHFSIVPMIVAETRMVAMFPRRLAESFQRQKLIRIAKCPIAFPPNNLSMAWHPRVNTSAPHRWVRQLIAGTTRIGTD